MQANRKARIILTLVATLAVGTIGLQRVFGCNVYDVDLWIGEDISDAESYNTDNVYIVDGGDFGWYVEWYADDPDYYDFEIEICDTTENELLELSSADYDQWYESGTVYVYDVSAGYHTIQACVRRDYEGGEWVCDDVGNLVVVKVTNVAGSRDVLCVGEEWTYAAITDPPNCHMHVDFSWDTDGGTYTLGEGTSLCNVKWDSPGTKTLTAHCGFSEASKEITVVEVASLLPDQGTEVDDGDNDPDTKRYFLFKADSGYVIVTAVPTPLLSEGELPDCWTLTGGTGTSKLTRTIGKTAAATTEITCTAGSSSKQVTFHVIEAEVNSVGFTSDHMIREWVGGDIDNPDGSAAVWTSTGTNDPVCYTKNTPPTMFAGFAVTPSIPEPEITGISVRAKVGTTIIGSASGCKLKGTAVEDGSNTDGDVDAISGGSSAPGSDGVKTLTPTFAWEVSSDGINWCSAASSGAHTMHWTDATPAASPLYDLGLEKACGYVDGASDIPGEINTDFAGEISYDPGGGCTSHGLGIFSAGSGQCCCHADVFCLLISHVTPDSPSPTDTWGGCSSTTHCHFKNSTGHGPTFQCDRPAEDSASANPHFNFHAQVSYGGTVYDPSYGLTGWPTMLELAPVVGGSHPTAASQQTGSYPPARRHTVNWTCPH